MNKREYIKGLTFNHLLSLDNEHKKAAINMLVDSIGKEECIINQNINIVGELDRVKIQDIYKSIMEHHKTMTKGNPTKDYQ